ncbi:MAG: thioester reductase domain-containing protein [Verrucomicrobiota bacterium]
MMNLEKLLSTLKSLDVRLWVEGSALRCDAPQGALTNELKDVLRYHKKELVDLLSPSRTSGVVNAWEADIVLSDEFRFEGQPDHAEVSTEKRIFLTGATGFLGAYLLSELIQQTQSNIICLVRGNTQEKNEGLSAFSRVEKSLAHYGLWQDGYKERLLVLEGDLSKKQLGLSNESYLDLITTVGCIFHNGAYVHHGLPYTSLRATNVKSTKELLRLAFQARSDFHYVSTLGVLPPLASEKHKRFYEKDSISLMPPPRGGYNLSKWVSERLVEEAASRGLAVTVYRPGPISGDSTTGVFNDQDFLCRLVRGYMASEMAPEGKTPLDLLPVDYVGKAVVWLSQLNRNNNRPVQRYHLIHPRPVSSEKIFQACQRAGLNIKRVPYQTWYDQLAEVVRKGRIDHPLYPLAGLFASRAEGGVKQSVDIKLPFDITEVEEALRDAPFLLPALNAKLFDKYLEVMLEQELVQT